MRLLSRANNLLFMLKKNVKFQSFLFVAFQGNYFCDERYLKDFFYRLKRRPCITSKTFVFSLSPRLDFINGYSCSILLLCKK